jgi:hypothetical protein
MPAPDCPSLLVVMSVLHDYVEEALNEQGIYQITAYGWSDADTIDPAFVGHALWQSQPPTEPDWQTINFNGGMPRSSPTVKQESLVTCGEDFMGAMLAARHATGTSLCVNKCVAFNHSDDDEYWLQNATSLLWLGIASDRIREFFLLAVFGQSADQFFSRRSGPRNWGAPFTASLTLARNQHELTLLTELEALGLKIQSSRSARNTITHVHATRAAARSQALLSEQRTRATTGEPYPSPADLTLEELRVTAASTAYPQGERAAALEEMKEWYQRLAHTSNIIFQIEYNRRH